MRSWQDMQKTIVAQGELLSDAGNVAKSIKSPLLLSAIISIKTTTAFGSYHINHVDSSHSCPPYLTNGSRPGGSWQAIARRCDESPKNWRQSTK